MVGSFECGLLPEKVIFEFNSMMQYFNLQSMMLDA